MHRRHSGPAGSVGRRFSGADHRSLTDRHDRLHVRRRSLAVLARTFAVSWLAAISADLSGLEDRLRPPRILDLDRNSLGVADRVLFLHAAANSKSRIDAG